MEKDWMIKPFDNNVVIPVYTLWFSIIISQSFVTFFVLICIGNTVCGYVMAAAFILMDIVSGIRLHYIKKKEKGIREYYVELDDF